MNKFTLTEAQAGFISSLKPHYTHICAYGGAGSGKTFTFIFLLILRAVQFPKSRHLIVRATRSSALASIIEEGFALYQQYDIVDKVSYKINYSTLTIYFANGSVIRCLGCDHKKHFGRILGTRYSTIYLNECSELNPSLMFGSNGVITRLGQGRIYLTPEECEKYCVIDYRVQLDNLGNGKRYIEPVNQVFYDFNPPTKAHWTYKYFIKKIHPVTNIEIDYKEKLLVAKINTASNKHLAQDYEQTAKEQGLLAYKRFYEGDFQDIGGNVMSRDMFSTYYQGDLDQPWISIFATIDVAFTDTKQSDYSVFCVWGVNENKHLYLLDMWRFKGRSGTFDKYFYQMYMKWKDGFRNGSSGLRGVYLEKIRNERLIDELQVKYGKGLIKDTLPRSKDKFSRFLDAQGFIEQGNIFLPNMDVQVQGGGFAKDFLETFLAECEAFSDDPKNYENDDIVDCVADAVYVVKTMPAPRKLYYGDDVREIMGDDYEL